MDPNQQPQRPAGPVMDVQRPTRNQTPSSVMAPANNPVAQADNAANIPIAPVSKPKKDRTGLIVAIITIVVVLLIAAGVAAFIIYKNRSQPDPAPAVTETESERVDVDDIDATIADIDKIMNTLNDSTDVTPTEVSDQAIGL